MKKTILTSIMLLAFMLLASCVPPEAPNSGTPVKPGGNSDEGAISQNLHINFQQIPDRTLAYHFYVSNGEDGWMYSWELIGGNHRPDPILDETLIVQMMTLDWDTTYTVRVTAYDRNKNIVGRGATEISRQPSLTVKVNLIDPITGKYELRPVLDIHETISPDQKFEWTVTDGEGKKIGFTDGDHGMISFLSTEGPIRVTCSAEVGGVTYEPDEPVVINVVQEGIKGNDTFISGQGKVTYDTNKLFPYSPYFTYYHNGWTEEDYAKYDYFWTVNGKYIGEGDGHGSLIPTNSRDVLIDVSVKAESLNGKHSIDTVIECIVTEKANQNNSWAVEKVVTYIPFLDVVRKDMTDPPYMEVWFEIPFRQDGYDYDLMVGGDFPEKELGYSFGTTSYQLIYNIPKDKGKYYDEYYLRVRGRANGQKSTSIYSQKFWFKVNPDGESFTWLN